MKRNLISGLVAALVLSVIQTNAAFSNDLHSTLENLARRALRSPVDHLRKGAGAYQQMAAPNQPNSFDRPAIQPAMSAPEQYAPPEMSSFQNAQGRPAQPAAFPAQSSLHSQPQRTNSQYDRWGLSANFPLRMPPGGVDDADLFAFPLKKAEVYQRRTGSLTDENAYDYDVKQFMIDHQPGASPRTRGSKSIRKLD